MLIGASLLIMSILVIFSLVLGSGFIGGASSFSINNEAIVDGVSNTYVVNPEAIFYSINTGTLVGAITILTISLVLIAGITGITVLATGLNPQSARIIILASVFGIIWTMLSLVAYPLVVSIPIFGGIIYVFVTIAFTIGAIQKITGGNG